MKILHIVFVSFLGGNVVFATTGNPPPATSLTLTDPLSGATFTSILGSITAGITTLAVPLAVIMILYGGIQLMVAGGDPERAKSGKSAISYAVIGLAVVLAANGIVAILREILGA